MKYVSISSVKEFWKRGVAISQNEGYNLFVAAAPVAEEEVLKLNISRRFASNEVGDALWSTPLNRINLKFNLKNIFESSARMLGVVDDCLVDHEPIEFRFLSLSRLFFSYQRKAGVDLRVALKSNYNISMKTSFSSILLFQRAVLTKPGVGHWGSRALLEFPFKVNLASSSNSQTFGLQRGSEWGLDSRPDFSLKTAVLGEILYWIPFSGKEVNGSCGVLYELAMQLRRTSRLINYFSGVHYFDSLYLFRFWSLALNQNSCRSRFLWQALYLTLKGPCNTLKDLVKTYSLGKVKCQYLLAENLVQILNLSGLDYVRAGFGKVKYYQFLHNFFLILLYSYSQIGLILHHCGPRMCVIPSKFTSSHLRRGSKVLEWVAAFFGGTLDFITEGLNSDKNFLGHYRLLNKLGVRGKHVLFPFKVREDHLNFQSVAPLARYTFLWYFLGNLLPYPLRVILNVEGKYRGFINDKLQKLLFYRRIRCSLHAYNVELRHFFPYNLNIFLGFTVPARNEGVSVNAKSSSVGWLFNAHSRIFAKNFEINAPPVVLQVPGELEATVSVFGITGSGLPHSAFFFRNLSESRGQFRLCLPNSLLANQFSIDGLFNRQVATIFNLTFFDLASLTLLRRGLGGSRFGSQTGFDRLGRKLVGVRSIFKSPLNRMKFFFNRLDSNIAPTLLFTNSFVLVQETAIPMSIVRNVLTRQFFKIGPKQRWISRRRFKFKQKRFSTSAQLYYGISFKNIFYTL